MESGLRLVYTPFAELRHLGHQSRKDAQLDERAPVGRADSAADVYLLHRWGGWLREDPFYTRGMRQLIHDDNSRVRGPRQGRDAAPGRVVGAPSSAAGRPRVLVDAVHPSSCSRSRGRLKEAGMLVVCATPTGGELVEDYSRLGIPVVIDETILGRSVERRPVHAGLRRDRRQHGPGLARRQCVRRPRCAVRVVRSGAGVRPAGDQRRREGSTRRLCSRRSRRLPLACDGEPVRTVRRWRAIDHDPLRDRRCRAVCARPASVRADGRRRPHHARGDAATAEGCRRTRRSDSTPEP